MKRIFKLSLVLLVGMLSIFISEVNAQNELCLYNYSDLSGTQIKLYKGTPVTGLVCEEKNGLRVEIPFINGVPDGVTKT